MRRLIVVLSLILLLSDNVVAQDNNEIETRTDKYTIKTQVFMGSYLDPSGNIQDINPNAPTGLNLGVEFPSNGQRPWQQYLNDPTVGIGLSYLNLGNDGMGEGMAMYPYIRIYGVRSKYIDASLKVAAGLVAVNGHYRATVTNPIPNKTFGSLINAYLSAGLNLDFPVARNVAINGEFGFYHISNGRSAEPNKGANILYGGLGLLATLEANGGKQMPVKSFPDLPYKWSLNITAAAGAQNADVSDEKKFLISTFHVGAVYSPKNWYGVGLGLDVFFNDAVSSETNRELFCRAHDYSNFQKTRIGLSIDNEFKFGDVTAMVDWGIYLVNPSRHYFDFDHRKYGHNHKLPLFYKSDGPGSQEGWNYIRFGLKYRVWDNLYLQALAKTHLHICEYIEFGIGYQIPFLRKDKRGGDGKKIFHHSRTWWENY